MIRKIQTQAVRLKEAVLAGSAERVGALIDQEIRDPNIRDAGKATPLHWAAGQDLPDPAIVLLLLDRGADPDLRDADGKRPVDIALAGDAALEERTESGKEKNRDIHRYYAYRHIVEHLRDASSRRAVIASDPDLELSDRKGRTAVHYAAANGDVTRLQQCLRGRIDCNRPDHDGNTPTMLAVFHAKPAAARALASQMTPHKWIYGQNARKEHPLHLAVQSGCDETLAWVLEKNAEAEGKKGATGGIINKGDRNGETPLHHAARAKWAGAVRLLLEQGARVLAAEKGGTPLLLAIRQGSAGICRALLPHSEAFRNYDPEGGGEERSAEFYLSQAIEHGTPEVVEAILAHCPAVAQPRVRRPEALVQAEEQLRAAGDGGDAERARRILQAVKSVAGAPARSAPEPEMGM